MTKTRDLSDFLIEGGADLPLGKPHIVPGVLYPSYVASGTSNKLLDGTTDHSGAFGTTQSDGRKYYYTNIAGSKPIKDPRIGGHFGSQRYKFKSLQLLEQETATSGVEVHSIDGREWMRTSGKLGGNTDPVYYRNDNNGVVVQFYRNGTGFIELTGYFNDANFIHYTGNGRGFQYHLDGGSASATLGETTANTPLTGRYVDGGSVTNLGISTTLGIHTLKIRCSTADDLLTYGIELISQDTSNRNNIQIPSQNVVSFGKKFSVSGTPHYDPFTTMSYGGSGTTLSALQSLIDTDTSLGMDAWKAGTSNYHRPWNGGRVIKWVDSSGTIKTSVNMMPPNAQNMSTTASNAVSDAEVIAGTNAETINFDTSAIDHTQTEIAKTFHFREFGNGNANGGVAGTYKDASMLDANSRDIAYVMDDGLTSLSGDNVTFKVSKDLGPDNANDTYYITFIGTGVGKTATQYSTNYTLVQNLPYGTHVLKVNRQDDNGGDPDITIDGISFTPNVNDYGYLNEITFYQPKRPPIPEDACVLADYMLMADFVAVTSLSDGKIHKGVRRNSGSRDHFYNVSGGSLDSNVTLNFTYAREFGLWANQSPASSHTASTSLPFFGTRISNIFENQQESHTLTIDGGSDLSGSCTKLDNSTINTLDAWVSPVQTLGLHNFTHTRITGGRIYNGTDIATPIHTSHHYQPFETPFLHELVGGDRNMEQTNLVCSPDGKTWDQITRDTSYIGDLVFSAARDGGNIANSTFIYDWFRGKFEDSGNSATQKHWAIAYDRLICLTQGTYQINTYNYMGSADSSVYLQKNATGSSQATGLAYTRTDPAEHTALMQTSHHFKRGDYITVEGSGGNCRGDQTYMNQIQIKKL